MLLSRTRAHMSAPYVGGPGWSLPMTRLPSRVPHAAELPLYLVPGSPGEAGFAHGRALRGLLTPAFVAEYTGVLARAIRFTPDGLASQARSWLANLPEHFREEIDAMGAGSGLGGGAVAEFLYADIARAETPSGGPERALVAEAPGPMCSAVVARLDDGETWIARNCDWLVPTLMRGTAAVVHETPHRIPVLAVGIRGDIDLDTGINAERLWLHLHTLAARDDPPRERSCISWLFWAREALEVCASLDELERFIASTARDRGVFAVAGDGKTGEAAVFECACSTYTRHDFDPARPACVTNHSLARPMPEPSKTRPRAEGTVGRAHALRRGLAERAPERGPDDLIALLAADGVEMRTPTWLRTIYSAVVRPRDASLWFASGDATGSPAASGGSWRRVTPPWESPA